MKRIFLLVGIFSAGFLLETESRTWTMLDGRKFEAELVHVMGGKAVLQDAADRMEKVGLGRLSLEDRLFIELSNPPWFEISFRRKTAQKRFSSRFSTTLLPKIQINTFGVRIKQKSAGAYNHALTIEFFAIAKERAGKRFILLDRKKSLFIPTEENNRSHQFWGRAVELDKYEIFYIDKPRGKKYEGHLIVVTDVRGKVVASQSSPGWLLKNIKKLKLMPIGGYMDKTCARTFPTRPKACRY